MNSENPNQVIYLQSWNKSEYIKKVVIKQESSGMLTSLCVFIVKKLVLGATLSVGGETFLNKCG